MSPDTGRPLAIPKLLGIPWWSLLLLGFVDSGIRFIPGIPSWIPTLSGLWFLVQAGWLKAAEPRSRALYFYVAMTVLGVCSGWLHSSSMAGRWQEEVVMDSFYIAMLVGIYVFRSEMQQHFRETDPRGMELGPVMTFFFSSLYFQYWFHQIYVEQNEADPRITF